MFEFYTLENGVKVILSEMSGVESVGVGVFVGTGSRFETPEINGISHFLEHMAFKGTKKYPSHTDTSRLEGLGAIQNAWTDVDATAFWCKIPSNRWAEALDLVADLALTPQIPEKDLEIERGVILEEINRKEDRPDELVEEVMQGLMYPNNPLGMTILGDPTVIKSVSRADFIDYHQLQYVSNNIAVVIAGKLPQASSLKSQITNIFGGLDNRKPSEFVNVEGQSGARWKVLRKDLANQAHVELAWPGVNMADSRRFAVAVLNSYLGQGLSSRLFIELREKRGLCYAVSSGANHLKDVGTVGVSAGLNIDKLESAISGIVTELSKIKLEKLSSDELEKAKEKIRGPMIFAMENPVRVMEYYARQVLDRPEDLMTPAQVIEKIMAVTAEQIQQVAQELYVKDKLNLAVVGPVEEKRVEKIVNSIKI